MLTAPEIGDPADRPRRRYNLYPAALPIMFLRPLLLLALAATASNAAVELRPLNASPTPAFPLVAHGAAATLVLPADAPEVVRLAAADFAADVERVTGRRPELTDTPPADPTRPRVTIALSAALAARWEAFQLSATTTELTVAGADRRALAFGLYELSRRIGVSPWAWWADVPVERRAELHLSTGADPIDQPAVKYRGIFLNDEGWGLRP